MLPRLALQIWGKGRSGCLWDRPRVVSEPLERHCGEVLCDQVLQLSHPWATVLSHPAGVACTLLVLGDFSLRGTGIRKGKHGDIFPEAKEGKKTVPFAFSPQRMEILLRTGLSWTKYKLILN